MGLASTGTTAERQGGTEGTARGPQENEQKRTAMKLSKIGMVIEVAMLPHDRPRFEPAGATHKSAAGGKKKEASDGSRRSGKLDGEGPRDGPRDGRSKITRMEAVGTPARAGGTW